MTAADLPIERRALLTPAEAATYAGVSDTTMRAWMTLANFPAVVLAPLTTPRIVRQAFDRWLETEAELQALTRTPCTCSDDPTIPCQVHPPTKELAA